MVKMRLNQPGKGQPGWSSTLYQIIRARPHCDGYDIMAIGDLNELDLEGKTFRRHWTDLRKFTPQAKYHILVPIILG